MSSAATGLRDFVLPSARGLCGTCPALPLPESPGARRIFFLPAFLAQQWLALLALVLQEALGFGSVSVTRSLAWVQGGRLRRGAGL